MGTLENFWIFVLLTLSMGLGAWSGYQMKKDCEETRSNVVPADKGMVSAVMIMAFVVCLLFGADVFSPALAALYGWLKQYSASEWTAFFTAGLVALLTISGAISGLMSLSWWAGSTYCERRLLKRKG